MSFHCFMACGNLILFRCRLCFFGATKTLPFLDFDGKFFSGKQSNGWFTGEIYKGKTTLWNTKSPKLHTKDQMIELFLFSFLTLEPVSFWFWFWWQILMYLSPELQTTLKSDAKEKTFSTNNTITCCTHIRTHSRRVETKWSHAVTFYGKVWPKRFTFKQGKSFLCLLNIEFAARSSCQRLYVAITDWWLYSSGRSMNLSYSNRGHGF